mmetsp:Transcript_38629/g.96754  ORF Transcript_38629/g.96754 Transcript_38629/m.96754 type:complete len:476 (-) Transcript_38629:573-2000(-)
MLHHKIQRLDRRGDGEADLADVRLELLPAVCLLGEAGSRKKLSLHSITLPPRLVSQPGGHHLVGGPPPVGARVGPCRPVHHEAVPHPELVRVVAGRPGPVLVGGKDADGDVGRTAGPLWRGAEGGDARLDHVAVVALAVEARVLQQHVPRGHHPRLDGGQALLVLDVTRRCQFPLHGRQPGVGVPGVAAHLHGQLVANEGGVQALLAVGELPLARGADASALADREQLGDGVAVLAHPVLPEDAGAGRMRQDHGVSRSDLLRGAEMVGNRKVVVPGRVVVVGKGHRLLLVVPQHRPHPLVHHQGVVVVLDRLLELVPQAEVEDGRGAAAAVEPRRHEVAVRVVELGHGVEGVSRLDVHVGEVARVALGVVEAERVEADVGAQPAEPLDDVGLDDGVGVVDVGCVARVLPRVGLAARAVVGAHLEVLLRVALPVVLDDRPLPPVRALELGPPRRVGGYAHRRAVVEHNVHHRGDAV